MSSYPNPANVRWQAVALYYAIACAISWPLRWARYAQPDAWREWGIPNVFKLWAAGLGPAVAALVVLWLYRKTHVRTVSLWGNSWKGSLAFLLTLFAVVTAIGIQRDGEVRYLSAALTLAAFFVYALLEEIGWRGFLEDALAPLPVVQRYVLLGAMWEFWHFAVRWGSTLDETLLRLAILYPTLIAASFGIGKSMSITRSLTVATCLHLLFNVYLEMKLAQPALFLLIIIPIWAVLLVRWPRWFTSTPLNT